MAGLYGTLKGAAGGFASTSRTGNPWLMGLGTAGGAILGGMEEDTGLTEEEKKYNQMQMEQMGQNIELGGMEIQKAKRMRREEQTAKFKSSIIGQRLGELFGRLK